MIFKKAIISELNKNEQSVIKYLTDNISKNEGITTAANNIGCSPSFITKTLKKVGYFGWKDFKATEDEKDVKMKKNNTYTNYIQNTLFPSIISTLNNIDEAEVSRLAKMIATTKEDVVFIGEGYSYYIAKDQARRYNKISILSYGSNATNYFVSSIRPKSIVLFISSSGLTESVNILNESLVKNKKLKTFLITANTRVEGPYKHIFRGKIIDDELINERELPRQSRIVLITILDWIFQKVLKFIDNERIVLINSKANSK